MSSGALTIRYARSVPSAAFTWALTLTGFIDAGTDTLARIAGSDVILSPGL